VLDNLIAAPGVNVRFQLALEQKLLRRLLTPTMATSLAPSVRKLDTTRLDVRATKHFGTLRRSDVRRSYAIHDTPSIRRQRVACVGARRRGLQPKGGPVMDLREGRLGTSCPYLSGAMVAVSRFFAPTRRRDRESRNPGRERSGDADRRIQ
jgi:hypothetical protein